MNRLEWSVMDWKEEEDGVVIMDDTSNSRSEEEDGVEVSRKTPLLAPLDSALASIVGSFNGPSFGSSNSLILDCQPLRYLQNSSFDIAKSPYPAVLYEE